ncbi:S8 family serine peptidase [Synechococcus sp. MU1625]|uniref:S8 family serine peptidase n=1 Tax=Synechococcus sp. MU1625 TaxID=2508347 RepID=UPI001CF83686|nr:S8 family serine peptidase [Synechococcus sp. MU1625]MCB4399752.1 S8 family serine peptidase [Synechococcus sp. MU1625]
MANATSIKEIIANLSEEELNTELKLATYFTGSAELSSTGTSYVDENLDSGEILPWGVKAVWDGEDLSLDEDGNENNFGGGYNEDGEFEGSYAFVIDSGVQELDDLNIEDNGWSKSWVNGEDAFEDGDGHGTHVAGTIAAKVDGKGVIGVAPGALITSLKVFNSSGGGASYSTVLAAIEYAAEIINENNLPKDKCVINLSLGGGSSPSIDQAVKNIASTGIQFAIAAGNEAQDADNVSPAGAGDAENVYTVSAVDNKMKMAWFSNWDDPSGTDGTDDVDVAAPGVNVLSYYKNGQLQYLNGTSMAAPGVAGLLITGGVEEGEMVTPNSAGYADPFALTVMEGSSDDEDNDDDNQDNPDDGNGDEDNDDDNQDNPDDGNGDEDNGNDNEDTPDDEIEEGVELVGNATGDYGDFFLSSGSGSVSQAIIENSIGISSGTLDGNLNNTKTSSNATEGSAVVITETADVGDTLSFNFAFATNDYVPYADYSFYTINGETYSLASIGDNVEDYGKLEGSKTYTFTKDDFDGEDSGLYTISFGVVDSVDTWVDSYLQISEFFVDDGSGNDEDEGDDGVGEPDYTFEYSTYGNAEGSDGSFDLSTGSDSISQIFIEKSLSLDLGTLDGSLGSTKGALNATEGSAIKAVTYANVGDVITFDYSFSTNDYQPFKDFSFFSVNGNAKKIAAVGEDTPDFGNKIGEISYTLIDSDFEDIESSNKVILGIGVMDALDTAVDSELSVNNIEISAAEEEEADEGEVVEEAPDDYYLKEGSLGGSTTGDAAGTFTLSTADGSVSQLYVESNLGLISNTLDSNLNGTKSSVNATEGSYYVSTGVAKVGDTITFDYSFDTNDYSPFKDFSFYSVNNKAYNVAAIGEGGVGDKAKNVDSSITYTFTESDFSNSSFGNYTFGIGVMDALDKGVNTQIEISNLAYNVTVDGVEEEEGEGEDLDIALTIESYGSSYKSGDKWKMSSGSGSISQSVLESNLQLESGVLDTTLECISSDDTKSASNATYGSGILAYADAEAGDTLSFSYTFSTNDYSPYNDFSFLGINGATKNVAAVGQEVNSYGSITSTYEYTLTDEDIVNGQETAISLGVVDAKDTAVDSFFSVWNLAMTGDGGIVEEEESEPDDESTTDVITIQEFGNAFESSTGLISMSTGYGAISQMEVELKTGLSIGELDGDLNESKDALNATEGSAMVASFAASAGDVVSFNYEFGTEDYIPYQDFSYYSVNGETYSLAVVGVDTPNYGSSTGVVNYTITDADITNAAGSNIQFSVGIMDALDTCVESYIKLTNFDVNTSGSAPTDINSNGLLDGLDTYMVSSDLENVSESVKLTDSGESSISETTSDNWNIDGMVANSDGNSLSGFDVLAIGTGSNIGKVAVWSADEDGVLTESIDGMDSSDQWVTIEEAVDSGYEEKFEKDFNNDGLISSATNNAGISLKNGSSTSENVELVNNKGKAIKQSGTKNFKVQKSLASSGFSLFNTETTDYQVLVEGKGKKANKYGIAEVDQTGVMGKISWTSKNFDTLENKYNEDIDGNNLINASAAYKVTATGSNLVIKNKKGVAINSNTSNQWDATAAYKSNNNNLNILLTGDNKKDGKVSAWTTDKYGIFKKKSGWKTISSAVKSNWESKYLTDIDNNGLITGGKSFSYKIASSVGAIELKNKSGNSYSFNSSKKWEATAAIETNNGFKVLLEGAKKKDGKVFAWTTNKNGTIKKGSGWKNISSAVKSDWENIFSTDINNDGLISGGSSYKLASSAGAITFKDKNGKNLNKKLSAQWDALAAVETESGFQVLVDGKGSKNGNVSVFTTNLDGVLNQSSSWQNEDKFFNTTNIFDFITPEI